LNVTNSKHTGYQNVTSQALQPASMASHYYRLNPRLRRQSLRCLTSDPHYTIADVTKTGCQGGRELPPLTNGKKPIDQSHRLRMRVDTNGRSKNQFTIEVRRPPLLMQCHAYIKGFRTGSIFS